MFLGKLFLELLWKIGGTLIASWSKTFWHRCQKCILRVQTNFLNRMLWELYVFESMFLRKQTMSEIISGKSRNIVSRVVKTAFYVKWGTFWVKVNWENSNFLPFSDIGQKHFGFWSRLLGMGFPKVRLRCPEKHFEEKYLFWNNIDF